MSNRPTVRLYNVNKEHWELLSSRRPDGKFPTVVGGSVFYLPPYGEYIEVDYAYATMLENKFWDTNGKPLLSRQPAVEVPSSAADSVDEETILAAVAKNPDLQSKLAELVSGDAKSKKPTKKSGTKSTKEETSTEVSE